MGLVAWMSWVDMIGVHIRHKLLPGELAVDSPSNSLVLLGRSVVNRFNSAWCLALHSLHHLTMITRFSGFKFIINSNTIYVCEFYNLVHMRPYILVCILASIDGNGKASACPGRAAIAPRLIGAPSLLASFECIVLWF